MSSVAFEDLPFEIVMTIISDFDPDELVLSISRVSKKIRLYVQQTMKYLFIKNYSMYIKSSIPNTLSNWSILYNIYSEAENPSNIFSVLVKLSDDYPDDIRSFMVNEALEIKKTTDTYNLFELMHGNYTDPSETLENLSREQIMLRMKRRGNNIMLFRQGKIEYYGKCAKHLYKMMMNKISIENLDISNIIPLDENGIIISPDKYKICT